MNHDQAVFLRDELLALVQRESRSTRRMLQAVPAKSLDYRPHAKAMSMREVAWHIVQAEPLLLRVIAQGTWDGVDIDELVPESVADMLAHYDRELPAVVARVQAMSGDELLATGDLFGAEDLLVRRLMYVPSHSIHHRGQLSAYLRAVGAYVPGVYGYSADDRERAAQGS